MSRYALLAGDMITFMPSAARAATVALVVEVSQYCATAVLASGRLGDLVPAVRGLAVLGDQRQDPLLEGQIVRFGGGVRLVAADVQVRPGGHRGQLTDDVLDEPVRDLLGDAQRAVADRGVGARRRRDPVAGQFRVRHLGGVDVSGHVDLGHDRHVLRGRVPDQVLVLGLGEVTAALAVDAGARRAADRGEPRPAVDLDAPALVVGEVQVQVVDLEGADLVDVPLDLVRACGSAVPGRASRRGTRTAARPRWSRPERSGRAAGSTGAASAPRRRAPAGVFARMVTARGSTASR